MPKRLFQVIKGNGEREYFNPEKLFHSLKRGGAPDDLANLIVEHILSELKDGMKTSEIFDHAFELLKDKRPAVAARYDLKRALMRLGPSGYPFEQFVGKIWESMGYKVQVGVIVSGKCIEHEVDVVAENGKEILMIECKYHNQNDTKSDIKTALYVHARMEDLEAGWRQKHPDSKKKFRGLLMTNTQFSSAAIQYAKCVNFEIISWDRPEGKSLKDMIDRSDMHPVTSLTSLNESQMRTLLNKGVVLCRDIPKGLNMLDLKQDHRDKIHAEAVELCRLKN
jgi:Holliday junction resolvase